jgi:formate hydrogenlyase transcriptional activator
MTLDGASAVRDVPSPVADGPLNLGRCALGLERQEGWVMIGARRPSFPTRSENALFRVAVNQAELQLRGAEVLAVRRQAVESERERSQLRAENLYLRGEQEADQHWQQVVGHSPALKHVLTLVEQVAPTTACVLVQGETGTGKELVARAVHRLSPRSSGPFVRLNCAAIPAGLLESELFGHEKGAFTGATSRKVGRFELAHQGTLFLDEIGELPLELQAKLLRVLQEREFERLGSTRTVHIDVRLVAASNRDLARMVKERQFRSDLYYRLKVFPILVPPLRARAQDIPLLVRCFIDRHAKRCGKEIDDLPDETVDAMVRYPWPGNVRELENLVERSVILSQGRSLEVPLEELRSDEEGSDVTTLQGIEREHILRALNEANWVIGGRGGAAAKLGVKRTSLQHKMQKLGISRPIR